MHQFNFDPNREPNLNESQVRLCPFSEKLFISQKIGM
jgi:hypothetical protein